MTPTNLILTLIIALVLFALYMSWRIARLAEQLEQQKEKEIDEKLKNESFSDLVRDANETDNSPGS